jgi:hypothetical protein
MPRSITNCSLYSSRAAAIDADQNHLFQCTANTNSVIANDRAINLAKVSNMIRTPVWYRSW